MNASAMQNVTRLHQDIADRIGAGPYRTWFGDAAQLRLDPDHLDVLVPNSFVGNWIASNYMNDLVASAQKVLGTEDLVEVRILRNSPGTDGGAKTVAAAPPPATHAPKRNIRKSRGALRGRLEHFVVGASNKMAYEAAARLVRDPGAAFKLLVLHGGCGLGKTHLLQGICNGIAHAHPTLEWRYISGEQFTNEFIAAVKGGNVDLFRSRFRSVDVLIIDDIHFLIDKKGTQKEFLHTFDAIDACGKAVVLSSDRHPRGIGSLSEPLVNRLIAGMVVEIDPPDFGIRREILSRRAAALRCDLPEEVVTFIAERVTRNVRELEGALYKLVAYASLTKDRITLELAETALDDHIVRTRRAPDPRRILELVATRFGVRPEQVLSRSRDRTVSLTRAVAMYLVRKHSMMSFPEIGRMFGNKNHSTVLMAAQRVEKWLIEGATVSWRSPNGRHEALLRGLLDGLELELGLAAA